VHNFLLNKDTFLLFINKYLSIFAIAIKLIKMKSNTEKLIKAMNIIAWIVFIGLLIVAGSIIISYVVSIGNPPAAKDLYKGMDLFAYRQQSFVHYTFVVGYKAILNITQAYIAFLMTRLLSKLNISKPFNPDIAQLTQKISYAILGVWLIIMVHNIHLAILEKSFGIAATYISGDSIFLAGIVYVLAQMFKRGVEIQSENELTV
jgi:hypothetical protein